MPHADIQERLNQIAIWVMDASAEDFESLARIHTGLQEAVAADPSPPAREAIARAMAALEPIILRERRFEEGIGAVRAALDEAIERIGEPPPRAETSARPAAEPTGQPAGGSTGRPTGAPAREPSSRGPAAAPPAPVAKAGRYLTFDLGDTEYGIPVLAVREILRLPPVTRVPRVAPAVRGVINLRGAIIPVIDLRLLLGLPAAEETRETSVVVLDLEDQPTGIIVDRVCEVLDVPAAAIEPPPRFGEGSVPRGLLGIGTVADRARLLLDMPSLLSREALGSAAPTAA